MSETGRSRQAVRFGMFEVDPRSGELRKAGMRIKLQEQPFRVLTALLEHPGEVVTREELRLRIWPQESFGDFDHAVNMAVAKLRTALGDSAETPRFIETLHRRGYRFIFPIAITDPTGQAMPTTVPVSAGRGGVATESRAQIASGNAPTSTPARAATSDRSRWLWSAAVLILAVVGGGTFAWLSRPFPTPGVVSTTQITHDGFDKTNVLTDGSRVYITESTGWKQSLVQVSVAGGETSVISTPFANIAISDISPDHSLMLVVDALGTENESQVWALPLPAGAPRRLGDIIAHWNLWSPGWAVWSPDGRQLAFAKGSEIYMAKADGTNVRKLVTLSGSAGEIRFSPDGTHLRFTLRNLQSDSRSVWEVRSDGTDLHPVLPGWHSNFSHLAGDWSPDGRYYFFTSCDNPNRCSVWTRREPEGFFHRKPSPVPLTAGPTPVFLNAVSPDGRTLFVSEWSGRSELVRYNTQSHQFVTFLRGISATELDFSRNGKWVTYVSEPDRTLWSSRLDGSERLQLTSTPVSAFLPRWSPDGTQIVYVDQQTGPFWKMFLISAQGGTPREILLEDQNQLDPSWSPDGKQLAFGRVPWLRASTEKVTIQIVDLDSKQVSTIPGSENLFSPRWSPDGQRLAAVSIDSKKLLLFDFKTKKWTDWINESGAVTYPTWSRDGRYIWYDNISSKTPGYRRVRVGQNRSELLVDLKDLRRGIPSQLGPWSGIAPDGSALFERDLSTGEIYSLQMELP